jgi:hypothetical protein
VSEAGARRVAALGRTRARPGCGSGRRLGLGLFFPGRRLRSGNDPGYIRILVTLTRRLIGSSRLGFAPPLGFRLLFLLPGALPGPLVLRRSRSLHIYRLPHMIGVPSRSDGSGTPSSFSTVGDRSMMLGCVVVIGRLTNSTPPLISAFVAQ